MKIESSDNPVNVRNIVKIPKFIIDGIKFKAAGKLYTPKPLFSTIRVTHRCNSRCMSCVFWKENKTSVELSAEEIGRIYKNDLFSSLEVVTFSGGEATLRDDLAEIAHAILNHCRNVKTIALCTNGLDHDRVIRTVKGLLKLTESKKNVGLNISTSVDGIGKLQEVIRGVPNAFEKINKTIVGLQELQKSNQLFLSANCTVQPLNMLHLEEISIYGKKNNLPITFSPICTSDVFTDDNSLMEQLQFNAENSKVLLEIFKNKISPYLRTFNKAFWQDYFKIIHGSKRRVPCYLLNNYVQIDGNGIMRGCDFVENFIYGNIKKDEPDTIWFSDKAKRIRQHIKNNFCWKCTVNCNVGYSLSKEFFYYAKYLFKEKTNKLAGRDIDW